MTPAQQEEGWAGPGDRQVAAGLEKAVAQHPPLHHQPGAAPLSALGSHCRPGAQTPAHTLRLGPRVYVFCVCMCACPRGWVCVAPARKCPCAAVCGSIRGEHVCVLMCWLRCLSQVCACEAVSPHGCGGALHPAHASVMCFWAPM